MSKGSKIVPVRIPDDLLDEMLKQIDATNLTRKEEPFRVGAWIRQAIQDKLAHNRRSRCWRRNRGLGECTAENRQLDCNVQGSVDTVGGGGTSSSVVS
jgi:hypothetical protein